MHGMRKTVATMNKLSADIRLCCNRKATCAYAYRWLFSKKVSEDWRFTDMVLNPTVCSRHFHSSTWNLAGKAKNTKKKLVQKVKYKPKSIKSAWEVVEIRKSMTIQEIARTLKTDIDHVFGCLLYIPGTDRFDTEDSLIDDIQVIKQIVDKSGFRWKLSEQQKLDEVTDKDVYKSKEINVHNLRMRPPVVTIMGHVDHGKTTLLDSLRKTNVVAQEFGGITQHIGAFSVKLPSGEEITFLDTPGHAAFSAMRARGAHVTDIVVLVVAADDGVMKQTEESIRHAQEAKVPLIVAINKIDKPQSDEDFTKQMLLQSGIHLEDIGGDVQSVSISALKGTNIGLLQESIVALSEVLELKADPFRQVEGSVIEAKTQIGRGKLCTALIQHGTLRKGDVIVAGTAWAKVRGMFGDKGRPVVTVTPGKPVEIIGWRDLPSAGEDIIQVESEQRAKEVVAWRLALQQSLKADQDFEVIKIKMEDHQKRYEDARQIKLDKGFRRGSVFRSIREKEIQESWSGPELAVVVKSDVDGSLEAILDTLDTYNSEQCRLHLLNYGVGPVSEQDIEMASAFNGIVYRFNIDCPDNIGALAATKYVPVVHHNIIYKLIDDLKRRLAEKLPPINVEETVGEANVLQTFMINEGKRKVTIAGCRCTKGILKKKLHFKLIRDGEEILNSSLTSLKHFKNEVDSIKTDVECGLSFDDKYVLPRSGDVVVCYELKESPQTLDWDIQF